MSDTTCAVCLSRPTPDGYACGHCAGRAAGHLAAIIELAPDARAVAAGLVRRGGGGASGKPGSRPPLNDGATDVLDAVTNALTTLARDIAETRGPQSAAEGRTLGDPLARACSWLLGQMEWLRHAVDEQGQPYAVAAFAEIAQCAGRLRGLVNGPAEQKYLGPCGAPMQVEITTMVDTEPRYVDGPPCEGDIYGPRGGSRGRCRTCGAEVAQADRQAWLDGEVRAHAFTAAQIAEAYAINVKTIRSWATDRPESRDSGGMLTRSATPARLRTHATGRDGQPLFLVGDVLDLAAADAARREERRSNREQKAAQAEDARVERERRIVGYMAVHQRLRRERGPASSQGCARCDRPAADWAYDHGDPAELPGVDGPYSLNPDRYLPLCRLCHKALDRGRARVAS